MTSKRFFELEDRCKKLKKAKMARYIVLIFTLCMGGLGSYYYFFGGLPNKPQEVFQPSKQEIIPVEVSQNTPVLEVSVEENSTQEVSIEAEKKETYDTLFLQPKVNHKKNE